MSARLRLAQCLGLVALLSWAAAASALDPDKAFHHYVIDRWTTQSGLPQTSVLSITQDRAGYLWVGTQGGLARFDGMRFTSYTPEDTPGLPGIWIRALLTDRSGRLWIGTYKGLAVRERDRFIPVPPADPAMPTLDVFALAEKPDGTLLAATSEGVFRVDRNHLVAIPGSPRPATSLLVRSDGLWVGTLGAVDRLANGRRAHLPLPAAAATTVVSQLVNTQGRMWAGTAQGVFTLDSTGWSRFEAHPALASAPVLSMRADGDGNLWIGTNPGLARLRGAKLVEFVPESHPRAVQQIASIYEDRERNLWLGSQPDGLARVWNGWTRRYSTSDGLHNAVVWSLSKAPDGRLWVGTNDGLSLFEHGTLKLVVPGSALPHPHAYNLLAEQDRVWIGTRRGLVVLQEGRVIAPPELAPLATAQINGIVRDPAGVLWITSSEGLYSLQDGTLRRYAQEQGLRDPRVRVIAFLREGRTLLGTQSGLYELRDGHARQLGLDAGLAPELDVTSIIELHDGRLVIGTLDQHISVLAGGRWHRLGEAEGIPANSAFFLTEDPHGMVWIAGIRGVSRVPASALPATAAESKQPVPGEMVLTERSAPHAGQPGLCCNGAGMSKGFRDADGVLWLPSRDGVVALDTRAIVKNPLAPSVIVERVRTRDGWRTPQPGETLGLPADARDLGFEFTVLSFQDPHSTQLRYRLRGYDPTWHHVQDTSQRSANYTNLPPGDYAFEVIGANNAGVWSRQPATLHFTIAPWFYETRLFQMLAAALAAVSLYAIYRHQQWLHARQRAELEKEVQHRTLELHSANARLEGVSLADPLTGLHNRRYLGNQLPADLSYYDREQQRSGDYDRVLVLAMVDMDRFKEVNTRFSRRVGDRVLQQVAQLLKSVVREGDYLVRWSGEEFLLVSRPMPAGQVRMLGERLRSTVAAFPFDVGEAAPLHLTCTVGLAEYPLHRDSRHRLGWEQIAELADYALYRAQQQHGRDGWAALLPTERTDLATLIDELRRDLDAMLVAGRLQLLTSEVRTAEPTA
ncbi:two-component regulator propeller domain-containing protein [Lysobacter tyrosinilyticus]